eukprot:1508855-Pleurochrysis_carterae.AAC.1
MPNAAIRTAKRPNTSDAVSDAVLAVEAAHPRDNKTRPEGKLEQAAPRTRLQRDRVASSLAEVISPSEEARSD